MISVISLLYPLSAMIYVLKRGAPLIIAFAYGISNLGYLLLFFGIFVGSFKVLRLYKRNQVIIASIVFWLIGVLMINVIFFIES